MIALLRQLNGAMVGFVVVVAAVGYVLSLRDPAGDVFAFTLIASLLCGALFGIPAGVALSRLLPAWPTPWAAWRVLALGWGAGGACLMGAAYLWEPRLVPYFAFPLLLTPLELAAFVARCRRRIQGALTVGWLGVVVFVVVQSTTLRERNRVASAQPPHPPRAPRPTPKPRATPSADEHRRVLERCTLPTRADSDFRGPVVRALRHFIESPDVRAVPTIIALDKRSLARGNVLGRYLLEALAASPTREARAYLAQQLASPRRHQETTRALEYIKVRRDKMGLPEHTASKETP